MRARRRLSRSLPGILATLLLLLASAGMVMGQESDTGQVSVSVLPAGSPTGSPGPSGTPEDVPGAPGGTGTPGEDASPGEPSRGGSAGMGTVSAWVVYDDSGPVFPGRDEPRTLLVVRDDRGTARGWAVTLAADGVDDTAWTPDLLENRTSTIVRILPRGGVVPAGGEQVSGGRTLGPLSPPLLALRAEPGSGAGVYLQELRISYPGTTFRPGGAIRVDIPCAP